jgi:hypothetical protein
MEELRYFWTVGSFELKEHVAAMGLGLLPAYWYFWQQPESTEHAVVRRWVTVFLALTVWYSFVVGHVVNNFRGVGSRPVAIRYFIRFDICSVHHRQRSTGVGG